MKRCAVCARRYQVLCSVDPGGPFIYCLPCALKVGWGEAKPAQGVLL